jgi:hypothetical protein
MEAVAIYTPMRALLLMLVLAACGGPANVEPDAGTGTWPDAGSTFTTPFAGDWKITVGNETGTLHLDEPVVPTLEQRGSFTLGSDSGPAGSSTWSDVCSFSMHTARGPLNAIGTCTATTITAVCERQSGVFDGLRFVGVR